MPYCTIDDLTNALPQTRIIELTDDEHLGVMDQAAVAQALSDADELIDGYLRGRYSLPLPAAPRLLVRVGVDLTSFNLYSRRLDLDMPEAMQTRYKNAMKLLEQIRDGRISLGLDAEGQAACEPGEYKTNKTPADRVFSKTVLDGF
jgi:phage gp36-like protein